MKAKGIRGKEEEGLGVENLRLFFFFFYYYSYCRRNMRRIIKIKENIQRIKE